MATVPEQSLPQGEDNERNGPATEWAERWLSPERLAPYLATCGGDIERALELYEWNISLGQSMPYVVHNMNKYGKLREVLV